LGAAPAGTQESEGDDCDDKQLQKEKEALAEALPKRGHVQILDRAAPEVGAGNFQRLTLELEEIERDDRGRDEAEETPLPPGERVDNVGEKHVTGIGSQNSAKSYPEA